MPFQPTGGIGQKRERRRMRLGEAVLGKASDLANDGLRKLKRVPAKHGRSSNAAEKVAGRVRYACFQKVLPMPASTAASRRFHAAEPEFQSAMTLATRHSAIHRPAPNIRSSSSLLEKQQARSRAKRWSAVLGPRLQGPLA